MKFKKAIFITLMVAFTMAVTSCSNPNEQAPTGSEDLQNEVTNANTDTSGTETENGTEMTGQKLDEILPIIDSIEELPQFSPLKEGEQLVTLKTNYGDITIRFFPEYAPNAVKNFVTLSETGYYNGVTFHRVINDFMIQSGDPTGTGTGGESIFGDKFDDEITPYLKHFTGAVAMANSGADTNGSQFYIVENDELSESQKSYMENFRDNPESVLQIDSETGTEITNNRFFSPVVAEEYIELGGTPTLDFYYTVFGQVIEGMDVVHKIAETDTYTGNDNGQSDKPKEDVIIESVEVSTYSK